MVEIGVRQPPELKDGSMTESMFDHMRFGWWPKDKYELRKWVAQAHKKPSTEIDDMRLRHGVEDFEAALARYTGQLISDWKAQGLNERAIYDKLFEIYNSQPRLDVHTSSMRRDRPIWTPQPIAYIAGLVGHVDPTTVGYDPTAGNGLLGITLNPKNFIANDLDERRFTNLKILETRAHLGDALTAGERGVFRAKEANLVLMNPPFDLMTDPQEIEGYVIKRMEQWIVVNNLDAMADKGRAVLILEASRDAGVINRIEWDFYHWLWANYNVVGHFEIEGRLYAMQGVNWPIRVLVIAGRAPSKLPLPTSGSVERLTNRDQIWERALIARDKAAIPAHEKFVAKQKEKSASTDRKAPTAPLGNPLSGADVTEQEIDDLFGIEGPIRWVDSKIVLTAEQCAAIDSILNEPNVATAIPAIKASSESPDDTPQPDTVDATNESQQPYPEGWWVPEKRSWQMAVRGSTEMTATEYRKAFLGKLVGLMESEGKEQARETILSFFEPFRREEYFDMDADLWTWAESIADLLAFPQASPEDSAPASAKVAQRVVKAQDELSLLEVLSAGVA